MEKRWEGGSNAALSSIRRGGGSGEENEHHNGMSMINSDTINKKQIEMNKQ
jgi:hypothetical protein